MVLDLAEVLGTQAVERGAVELGRPPDEVVNLRREGLVLVVVPGVLGLVAAVDEDVLGEPVLRLRVRKSPRSSNRTFLPDGASLWTSVPPPAPLPITITS